LKLKEIKERHLQWNPQKSFAKADQTRQNNEFRFSGDTFEKRKKVAIL
jgi:hypothetical protein